MATDPALTEAANQIKTNLSAKVPNATGTVGAFYVDPSDPAKLTMVVGATGKVDDPAAELDQVFAGAASSGLTVSDIHNVSPGTLSGDAKCGTAAVSGQPVVVCAWADPGSVGLMQFRQRDMTASADLFAQMRNGMLTRE
jgi:hypothetical protein